MKFSVLPSKLTHRDDIDGTRAIAVLAVVFYHFEVPGFAGGFTGVDIFFVISGFLIGGILWDEFQTSGRVSLLRFWIRRIRRLAPAFFVMATVVSTFAWFLLLPFELREFGKSLIAASFWLSNVLFWQQAGYFDAVAQEKVLLHTWSLAVEEQFYVFLPLLFLALARWRTALPWVVGGVCAASFILCLWMTARDQTGAFYLFPFRAWELLAGVLLAMLDRRRKGLAAPAALAWIGVALLASSITLVEPGRSFPGWPALLPVAGTLAIIAAGKTPSAVQRAISAPLPVGIGRLSYSLYLWHWPIFALYTYWRGEPLLFIETTGLIALSLVLSWWSWRFVEQPVRRARRLPAMVLAGGAATASAVTVAIGTFAYISDGAPKRYGPEIASHIAASGDFLQDWSRCTTPTSGPLAGLETCPIGPEGKPRVLVWGDSHVRAVYEGIVLAAYEHAVPGLIVWRAGCPPLFEVEKRESAATPAQDAACSRANEQMQGAYKRLTSVEHVLLVGRWNYYLHGQGIGLDAHNIVTVGSTTAPDMPQAEAVITALRDTVSELSRHAEVFVMRQPPEFPQYDSRTFARRLAHGWLAPAEAKVQTEATQASLSGRAALAEAAFRDLESEGRLRLLDSWRWLCPARTCRAVRDGVGLWFDNNHLTNSAALLLSRSGFFDPIFATAKPET